MSIDPSEPPGGRGPRSKDWRSRLRHAFRHRPRAGRRTRLGLAGAGLLALGIVVGGIGTGLSGLGSETVLPLKPQAIASLTETWSPVAISGKVADVFGNKLLITDASGRALVDAGPARWSGAAAKPGETVTVQGRFDDGVLHGEMLVHQDGSVTRLGPPPPPLGRLRGEVARIAGF
ncbi:hypothetical protein [Jiella mangrovi]|uniref:DNA-binding protein n=1 Tax=Jiella mangrovi TaxID=2821407 RepID=A0ABS4BC80_9HYPH|nr:hypothetical protein [Jiella mangrovi]MBP0614358.1 hypothetical protein [Jiella mangrovi]